MTKFEIRARFDDRIVRVYQAYNDAIADAALEAGRFVAPFKRERMTWIKPSFNWMMHRSGFAAKPDQERILAIDILREGFDWALENAVLSSYQTSLHASYDDWKAALPGSPVRVQWDPERDWRLEAVPETRSLQVGLSGAAAAKYVDEWTVDITDVTLQAHAQDSARARGVRPAKLVEDYEQLYPLGLAAWRRIVPG
jgi:hypothetical protein